MSQKFITKVYCDQEMKTLSQFNVAMDRRVGWRPDTAQMIVSSEMLRLWALAVDPWNPRFSRNARSPSGRYGRIIAAPFFLDYLSTHALVELPAVPKYPNRRKFNDGGDVRFYRPIVAGMKLSLYVDRQQIQETEDRDGIWRCFSVEARSRLVSVDGETVSDVTLHFRDCYASDPDASIGRKPWDSPARVYSAADWARIRELEQLEEASRVTPRTWEEVAVGDHIGPTIAGPTTVLDMIRIGGWSVMDQANASVRRSQTLRSAWVDEAGIPHHLSEGHYSFEAGSNKRPLHYQSLGRSLMARLITNLAGNRGWMTCMSWRNEDLGDRFIAEIPELSGRHVVGHSLVGDVLVAHGKVVRKWEEGGSSYAEVCVWAETLDGIICHAGIATVTLPREALHR